jgi:DNA polymerase delta subunit 1
LERIFSPIIGDGAKAIFSGPHTRVITLVTPKAGPLVKFAVSRPSCLGCRGPLNASEKTVCIRCKDQEQILYLQQLADTNAKHKTFSRLWVGCQICTKNMLSDVLCVNSDCKQYYSRERAKVDAGDATKKLARFDYEW